jgi:outer membrane protein OmpA-like peptidoglycan-associated protein
MSLKHILAITTIFGSLAAMAACQASFQAGAGSNTTPSANPGTAGAPAAAAPAATPAATPPASPAPTAASTPAAAAPSKVSLAGGKVVVQGSLTFDSGKAILLETPENAAIISDLKLFLDQNPKVTQMRIEGHTDNLGNADANLTLSGQRAVTIKNALIAKGLPKERLLAVGFGAQKPIADNATEAGRAQNQRVEFRVATWNSKNYLNQDPSGGGKIFE